MMHEKKKKSVANLLAYLKKHFVVGAVISNFRKFSTADSISKTFKWNSLFINHPLP